MHAFDELMPIREASRRMVRGLGILDPLPLLGMPFSQCHALIEIERAGATTVKDLADALRIDPSVASRVTATLDRQGFVRSSTDPLDARKRMVSLTPRGLEEMKRVHEASNGPVLAALNLLTEEQRKKVLDGLEIYGNALLKASQGKGIELREITVEDDAQVAQLIKSVMTEIGASGPGFSINDPEVLAMSDHYKGPKAKFFVIDRDKQILGCGGFAPLTDGDPTVCELRKMYFYSEARGLGKGQELMNAILAGARDAGFRTMYLETLAHLDKARGLYERNGFKLTCSPMGNTGHGSCDTFYVREL